MEYDVVTCIYTGQVVDVMRKCKFLQEGRLSLSIVCDRRARVEIVRTLYTPKDNRIACDLHFHRSDRASNVFANNNARIIMFRSRLSRRLCNVIFVNYRNGGACIYIRVHHGERRYGTAASLPGVQRADDSGFVGEWFFCSVVVELRNRRLRALMCKWNASELFHIERIAVFVD